MVARQSKKADAQVSQEKKELAQPEEIQSQTPVVNSQQLLDNDFFKKNIVQYFIGMLICAALVGLLWVTMIWLTQVMIFLNINFEYTGTTELIILGVIVAIYIACLSIFYYKEKKYLAIGMLFGLFFVAYIVVHWFVSYFVDPPSW